MPFVGRRVWTGGQGLVAGELDAPGARDHFAAMLHGRAPAAGYGRGHGRGRLMKIERARYADLYGPRPATGSGWPTRTSCARSSAT